MRSSEERKQRVLDLRRAATESRLTEQRAIAEAARRCRQGTGTLDDFALVIGPSIPGFLDQCVPMAVIGRARRQHGFNVGPRDHAGRWSMLAADVLSFPPNEDLDAPTLAELTELDRVLGSQSIDSMERLEAATARLIIGPDDGMERRIWCWYAADAEGRAETELCEPWIARHRALIDCWDVLNALVERIYEENPAPAEDPEDAGEDDPRGKLVPIASFAQYAYLIGLYGRVKAANTGQNRTAAPEEATSE